jgi:CMP-N-acetylneuraminic acid synthetase
MSPIERTWQCALAAGFAPRNIVITTDHASPAVNDDRAIESYLWRPPELSADDTPMVDVVRDVLVRIPGDPAQKVVLLQCTQPLREPKHLQQALELLMPEVDSVVSVVETRSPEEILEIRQGQLMRSAGWSVNDCPIRRQDAPKGYWRDGTVYAFWRKTVNEWGDIYGSLIKPLIIPASETQALDTPEDWIEAERRLKARDQARSCHWCGGEAREGGHMPDCGLR